MSFVIWLCFHCCHTSLDRGFEYTWYGFVQTAYQQGYELISWKRDHGT